MHWNGADIVVFNEVVIRPPYRVENVEAKSPGKQREIDYIKKLVMNQMNSLGTPENSTETSSSKKWKEVY